MAANDIPAFNSSRPDPYRRLYEGAMAQARAGGSEAGLVKSSRDGVETTVSLSRGTVTVHQAAAPVVDEYVPSLALTDSRIPGARIVRQNATLVMKPGPNGSLVVQEKAINYLGTPDGGEQATSTWTRRAVVMGEQLTERIFYSTLSGRTTPL